MRPLPSAYSVFTTTGAPFLPLAFRVAVSFGLLVVHAALPRETARTLPGEGLYLTCLVLIFLESLLEMRDSLRRSGELFAAPSQPWIRFNLAMDVVLVSLLVAFQGVEQERFATIYLFPVLASAFYLPISGIITVALGCSTLHALTLVGFAHGLLPDFGHTVQGLGLEGDPWPNLASVASVQVFAAALVVVMIRKHLETLRSSLQRSEAAVDQLSAMYRRVFESLFSGLVTLHPDGSIISANPAAEQILRRRLRPGDHLTELDLEDPLTLWSPTRERRFEVTFQDPDGHRRIVGGNVAPIRDAEGQQQGYLVLFQDLTELKTLEERTRLAEQMATIGGLAASLAHELRNPMASILGCVQLLRRGDPEPLLLDRALTILQRESERVSVIVSDFLEFAKPRDSKPQPLWFPSVVEDVLASWETDPRCAELPLSHDPAPPVWVEGDPLHVHQVFMNLLSNARKAVAHTDRPLIRITAVSGADGRLKVAVDDNGCGMSREALHSIFLPFSSEFPGGTGLGMSLVYRFVQQMGWDIEVSSQKGVGTRIQLSLPLVEPPAEPLA